MEKISTKQFRELLSKNSNNLKKLCKEWEVLEASSSIPEEVCDEIHSTIGLTKLLMGQKLKQFQGLIDDSELKRGKKEITCLDLQGFWDMVYNEIEKTQKCFEKLQKCKENNWVFVQETTSNVEAKKKLLPVKAKTSVISKIHASAARQRLAEVKLKLKAQKEASEFKPALNTMEDNSNYKKVPIKNDTLHNKENNVELLEGSVSTVTKKSKELRVKSKSFNKTSPAKKSRSKLNRNQEKENVFSTITIKPEIISTKPVTNKGKTKEVIPLQCVTRSAAKKAMMDEQNRLSKN